MRSTSLTARFSTSIASPSFSSAFFCSSISASSIATVLSSDCAATARTRSASSFWAFTHSSSASRCSTRRLASRSSSADRSRSRTDSSRTAVASAATASSRSRSFVALSSVDSARALAAAAAACCCRESASGAAPPGTAVHSAEGTSSGMRLCLVPAESVIALEHFVFGLFTTGARCCVLGGRRAASLSTALLALTLTGTPRARRPSQHVRRAPPHFIRAARASNAFPVAARPTTLAALNADAARCAGAL